MANEISKQKIVAHINSLVKEIEDSMASYTTKGKYYQILEQQRAMLFSLRFNITAGLFDEDDIETLVRAQVAEHNKELEK